MPGVAATYAAPVGTRSVLVLGGGVAGLSAGLMLARDGHRVTLVERDDLEVGDPLQSPDWERRGIPHFLQPHAFIPRGRSEMLRHLPDVHAELLDAGAWTVDLCRKLPGGNLQPGDEELRYLGVRRPLIEWGLRRAAFRQDGMTLRGRSRVGGLRVEGGRVTGVEVDGDVLAADLVVDAMGRRTPTIGWLAADGVDAPEPTTSDCGVVYYCRYYRLRPGADLPDGPWPLSPRGDLGYLAFSTFPGDNGTFAAVLAVPNGTTSWRPFKDATTFEAAIARIPALHAWADPAGVEPITDVLAMAGLRNSLRDATGAVAAGLLPVGDALGHSDPVLAHGLSFSLIHAAALTTALRCDDVTEAGSRYLDDVMPLLRERYEMATALDEQRHRMWCGGEVDFAHRDGDYVLFTTVAGGATVTTDPDIFRMVLRRITLLDSTAVLDGDVAMQQRIEDAFAQLMSMPRPAAGPDREQMLSLVSAHG